MASPPFRLLDGLGEAGQVVNYIKAVALLIIGISQICVLALVLNQTLDLIVKRVLDKGGVGGDAAAQAAASHGTSSSNVGEYKSSEFVVAENIVRLVMHMLEAGVVFLLPDVEHLIDVVSALTTVVMVVILPVMISWRWSSGDLGSKVFHGTSFFVGVVILVVGLYKP